MPDTMIERLAREMFRLRRKAQGASYFGAQDEIETDWRVVKSLYMDDAAAVLTAMREPTDAMDTAGGARDKLGYDPAPAAVWRAMIDAAIGEA